MPRSLVRGSQVLDRSIESVDLATDSVITEKIKDHNVTCEKLAVGLCDRLLSNDAPIGRIRLTGSFPANQDFVIPGGLSYDPASFVERVAIYRNGQLLYNGDQMPVDPKDPAEVYPGSTNQHIRFCYELLKGDTIQVITL
jgi:hypothetical protein